MPERWQKIGNQMIKIWSEINSHHLDAAWRIPQLETTIQLIATSNKDTNDFIIMYT